MVTTVASPSGIAATARLTATMNVESSVSGAKEPARQMLTAKMNAQMPSTSQESVFESCPSFFWSGVSSSSAWESAVAILPISVCIPVAVMTALPRP